MIRSKLFLLDYQGGGIEGLSSMNEKTTITGKINLIRPFLDIKKKI